jgi:hypothetical protein
MSDALIIMLLIPGVVGWCVGWVCGLVFAWWDYA